MGKSVSGSSSSSCFVYLDWCEAFASVANWSISDCRASDAWSEDILFAIPSSWIFTVSVVEERMKYGLSLFGCNFEN